VGGRGYWGWENVRAAFLYARLAEIARDPQPRRWIEDINGDGSDEQMLCDGRQLAVFTAYGGRLVGWFDLRDGRQWVGNPLAVPAAPYASGESEHPKVAALRHRWLPETFDADLKPWKDQKTREPSPTGLGRHLSPELFARDSDELVMYRNPPTPEGARRPLPAQTGALNDWLALDGGDERAPDGFVDYRFEPDDIISYLNVLTPEVRIEKRVQLSADGVRAHYALENLTGKARRLRWRLASELAPDYAAMLTGGRAALAVTHQDGFPAIRNTLTGAAVVIRPSDQWDELGHADHLLGVNLWVMFTVSLPARGRRAFDVALDAVQPAEAVSKSG
jgi:hypothetical protein